MQRLLVIDDDLKLAGLLSEYLGGRGYAVEVAGDGAAGLARAARGDVDLIVLDVMMPGMDGLEVLKALRREHRTPVVMLTARGDDIDRIIGLELGADDYLPKPFNPRELLARIGAVLRRQGQAAEEPSAIIELMGLRLDLDRRALANEAGPVELTTTEFDLLRALMQSAGRIIPRERMMELARGQEYAAFDRSVDVHISHLRRKLGDDPKSPRLIKTIRGVGYMFPRA